MKTAYGKLTVLIALLIAGTLLFAPMRFGTEDYLYAHPRSVKMHPGDSYALSFRLDSDVPQSVSYTSTDPSVAAVNSNGLVTAMNPGTAQVRLDAQNGAKATVQIEVVGSGASALALNTEALSLEKGQISGLRAIIDGADGDELIRWRSADESIAHVDAVGRVQAVGGGTTRVTASTRDGLSASATVNVHVSGTAMHITPGDVTLGVGSVLRLNTYFLPSDTTDDTLSWDSSAPGVLRVQEDGTVYALSEGAAVLSAFSRDGLSGSTVITVEPAAEEFEVSPAAATLERASRLTLQPRFLDALGHEDKDSNHYVTWTTSNPGVATVENGVVTAVNSGQARISAAADGKIASCMLTVQTLVEEVRLNLDEMYVLREQTVVPIQLEAQVLPADADDTRLQYTVDNELVATVSPWGLVTLTGGYGTATVTVRASSGAEAYFTVNVVAQLPEVTASPPDLSGN